MEDKKVTLKLENVSKVFAKVESDDVTHALYNVNAQMESGEFISLVGPSGCGKSTILQALLPRLWGRFLSMAQWLRDRIRTVGWYSRSPRCFHG